MSFSIGEDAEEAAAEAADETPQEPDLGSSHSDSDGVPMTDREDWGSRTCSTCPEWRYLMGIRYLDTVFGVTYHHLFMVQWNCGGSGGNTSTFSAFPTQTGNAGLMGPFRGMFTSDSSKDIDEDHEYDPEDPSDYGYIRYDFASSYFRSGEYREDNRFRGLRDTPDDLFFELDRAGQAMSERRIRYVPTGPNNNSFAMSLAERVGLPTRKPTGDAPGSGMSI